MLAGVDLADIHGQYKFNFEHAAISRDESKQFLDWAFRRDFERNGPSLYRICRTTLEGWRRYKNDPDPRVRERFEWEARQLRSAAAACCGPWSTVSSRTNDGVQPEDPRAAPRDREGIRRGCPGGRRAGRSRPAVDLAPRGSRLARGQTYEPRTIIERRNWVEAET